MSTATPQHRVNPLVFWMNIEVGGIEGVDHIRRLEDKGVNIDLTAREVMCNRHYRPGPKRIIRLGRCQVRDFGFTKPPTTSELVAIMEFFESICPCETTPHLEEVLLRHDERETCVTPVIRPLPDRHDTSQMLVPANTRNKHRIKTRHAHPQHRCLLHYEVVGVIPG